MAKVQSNLQLKIALTESKPVYGPHVIAALSDPEDHEEYADMARRYLDYYERILETCSYSDFVFKKFDDRRVKSRDGGDNREEENI